MLITDTFKKIGEAGSTTTESNAALFFEVGGLRLTLNLAEAGCEIETASFPSLAPFRKQAEGSHIPFYHLKLRLESVAGVEALPAKIRPEARNWYCQKQDHFLELYLRQPLWPGGWTHHLRLDLAAGTGCLRVANPQGRAVLSYKQIFPAYLDKFIFTCILTHLGQGCLVHAAALSDRGKGLLLVGESGAGKSTSSRLWREAGGPGVIGLSDECALVCEEQPGQFRVYGTPWPSSAGIADPAGVPLRRVYFLHHALTNQAQPVEAQVALLKLLEQGQLAFWDETGAGIGLETLIKLAQSVPAYRLGFVPDASVIEYVRQHLQSVKVQGLQ